MAIGLCIIVDSDDIQHSHHCRVLLDGAATEKEALALEVRGEGNPAHVVQQLSINL